MEKWNGKSKAVTFSFDDGCLQDLRTIEILDKYGLKATFNLNSARLGLKSTLDRNGHIVDFNKVKPMDVRKTYKNHEVAVHSMTHECLPKLSDEAVIWQVEQDRKILSDLVGYEIRCMAYACGGVNNDDRVAEIIKNNTGVKFARTITSSYNFDIQKNYYRYDPSVYIIEEKELFELGEKFINLKTDKPQVFYIWGHTFEMDAEYITWQRFEEFCKLISGKDDIFYGTNGEVLLD